MPATSPNITFPVSDGMKRGHARDLVDITFGCPSSSMLATTPNGFNNSEQYYASYVSDLIYTTINSYGIQLWVHFSTLYATHIHSYISHLQLYIQRFTSTPPITWLSSVYLYGTYIRRALHLPFASDKANDISLHAAAESAKHFTWEKLKPVHAARAVISYVILSLVFSFFCFCFLFLRLLLPTFFHFVHVVLSIYFILF